MVSRVCVLDVTVAVGTVCPPGYEYIYILCCLVHKEWEVDAH